MKYWCLIVKSTPATPLSWLLNSGIDEWNAYEFFLDFEDMQAQYNKLHGHTYSIFDVYFSVNILKFESDASTMPDKSSISLK